jgi:REP element-mobilizing transposase RayT
VTNEIFMYCLAFAMRKTDVRLHAACTMSNHHHLVVTDPNGVLPDFLRELHRLTAKAINASQGQWENLWAATPCNVVRLVTDEDIEDKVAYVVMNPVVDGLVRRPDEWPGFIAWRQCRVTVTRPEAYFSEDGECPAELELVIEPPPQKEERHPFEEAWATRIARRIAEGVAAAREALRAKGREVLGRNVVRSASFVQRAESYEEKRRTIPTFAARKESVRDHLRMVEQHFRREYRAAFLQWRRGDRAVEFPDGTWGMRVVHAASVAPPLAA